ncbi:hypothetical protein R3P38DRAFT_2415928, partial [Favolaschia claudopus]
LSARNEAIDLLNLQSYLKTGENRSTWCYFVDCILSSWLETSYLKIPPGQIINVFLQNVHLPISKKTPLPDQIKGMIRVAHKYNLTFTALTIENQVKLSLPIWRHPGIRKSDYDSINRRKTAECLRVNHRTRTVDEAMTLATRKTTV